MGTAAAWIISALVAWLGVNLVAVAAGAKIARLRRVDAAGSGADEPITPRLPRATPAVDGYASLLPTRLVVHARRMLGVDQAILLLRGQGQPNRLIVVAAHGTEEDLVGRAIPIRGALGGLVSDRPLRHGPLEEVVPDGGAATAITAAAAAPSGELAVLCAASTDTERGFTGRELELLGELASSCATAISDMALGARLEPTMRVLAGGLSPAADDWELPRRIDARSLGAQVGMALRLEPSALAELGMAARACHGRVTRVSPTAVVERLADVPGFEAVAIVVRSVAERWDGEGEPHGLFGDQIPLASRILAACLALDEMLADDGTSTASALRRLKGQRRRAFDPVVVDAIDHVLASSTEPLHVDDWAREDAQFAVPLLAAVA